MRFDGKTALVTGGSHGTGYACAEALLESGARVAIVGVDALEVAAAVCFPASEKAEMTTGHILVIDGGGSVVGYQRERCPGGVRPLLRESSM